MSEKKRININKNVEDFILSLVKSEDGSVTWSRHINRLLLDHIAILEDSFPNNIDPEVIELLKYISTPYVSDLSKFKYGQNYHQFFYSFYFKCEQLDILSPSQKTLFNDVFMSLEISHVEAISLITFLQLSTTV